jgi:hypothetical protein
VLLSAIPAYPLQGCGYHLVDGEQSANLQICNIVDDVFGRETIDLNSCVLAAFFPAKSERKRIPVQKASPRKLVKTKSSQLVSQGPWPQCWVLLDRPRKTTQIASGIRIANAPALL